MAKKRKCVHKKELSRSLMSGVISDFVRILKYKSELKGKKVVEIDERDTSKTCFNCGAKIEMPLYKRKFKCDKCGILIDRDRNSAINIMNKYLDLEGKLTSRKHFVKNVQKAVTSHMMVSQ